LIALDKDGQPVTDLKPEELHLFEDKIEQEIKSLSSLRVPLTIGIFFDISGSRRADKYVGDETRLAGEFLHSIWHVGDTAFVVELVIAPTRSPNPPKSWMPLIKGCDKSPKQGISAPRLSTTPSV